MQGKKQQKKMGRPTVMIPEALAKLEQAFAIDATVEEALSYAELKPNAYYDYLKANPDFSQRIQDLRNRPILKARMTIVKGLDDDKNAQWYLERKRKNEFAQRQEMTGADGQQLTIQVAKEIADKNAVNSSPSPDS